MPAATRPLTGRKRWVSRQVPGQTKRSYREAKKVEAELLEQVDRGQHRGSSSRTVAEAASALGRQAGLDGVDLRAVVEAASLAAAVQAKVRRAVGRRRTPHDSVGPADSRSVGADLASEVAWLTRIADAFTDSPVVAEVRARPSRTDQDGDTTARPAGDRPLPQQSTPPRTSRTLKP